MENTKFSEAIVKAPPQFFDLRRLLKMLGVTKPGSINVNVSNIKTYPPGRY